MPLPRLFALAASSLLIAASLSACSHAGDLTCKDYLNFDEDQRASLIRDLLDEHDLQTWNSMNKAIVREELDTYCRSDAHYDEKLENASDWR